MNKKNRYELADLISEACDDLNYDWKEIQKGHYDLEDAIHQIADSNVPIYYYDIGRYAGNNSWLMTEIPEINPEGNAHDQIQANIYQAIVDGLHEHISEITKTEKEEVKK
jgi:hypothetical protein